MEGREISRRDGGKGDKRRQWVLQKLSHERRRLFMTPQPRLPPTWVLNANLNEN